MITLKAVARDVKVNPKLIRKEGNIPAVYYGFGKKSTPISVVGIEFTNVLKKVGESSIFTLETPEGKLDALVHEIALHPVIGNPVHIDFYIASKDHKMQIHVPFEFIGVSPAEKEGGVVTKVMHELHIEALPAKLPQTITVDLAKLTTLGSHISVSDLEVGEGVKVLTPLSEVIALVGLPVVEEETPVAPVDLSAIEVEKKGKKEEEGAEEAK